MKYLYIYIIKINVSQVINHPTTSAISLKNDIPSASRKKIGKKLIPLPAKQFRASKKPPSIPSSIHFPARISAHRNAHFAFIISRGNKRRY